MKLTDLWQITKDINLSRHQFLEYSYLSKDSWANLPSKLFLPHPPTNNEMKLLQNLKSSAVFVQSIWISFGLLWLNGRYYFNSDVTSWNGPNWKNKWEDHRRPEFRAKDQEQNSLVGSVYSLDISYYLLMQRRKKMRSINKRSNKNLN